MNLRLIDDYSTEMLHLYLPDFGTPNSATAVGTAHGRALLRRKPRASLWKQRRRRCRTAKNVDRTTQASLDMPKHAKLQELVTHFRGALFLMGPRVLTQVAHFVVPKAPIGNRNMEKVRCFQAKPRSMPLWLCPITKKKIHSRNRGLSQ